jgi:hypothetical protein
VVVVAVQEEVAVEAPEGIVILMLKKLLGLIVLQKAHRL